MVYPASFHRLVIMGQMYTDIFNTTCSIIPVPGQGTGELNAVTQELADAVRVLIATNWASGAAGNLWFPSPARFTGIKLNRIGPDGKYQDPFTIESLAPAPVAGSLSITPPAQIATVATLRTPVPRGPASKGRMFFPGTSGFSQTIGTDGRATAANALRFADAVSELFNGIHLLYAARMGSMGGLGRLGVASDVGAGRFLPVTSISVGRVPDTIRSRRSSLDEDPQYSTALDL